jgi:membrane protein required for beta-lactamase induction
MTLIAVLLVVVTERFWHPLSSNRLFSPLTRWSHFLLTRQRTWLNGSLGVVLTILPPVLVTGLVQYLLSMSGGWSILLGLLFAVVVLIACVGDRRFGGHVNHYIQAVSSGDLAAATIYFDGISSHTFKGENLRELNRAFIGLLLLRMNERVLALLFWFVILGPLGAVFYRSVAQLRGSYIEGNEAFSDESYQDAVLRCKAILDWCPARLTAFTYAVIGSFVDAIQLWRKDPQRPQDNWLSNNDRMLIDIGIGAMQLGDYYLGAADKPLDNELACVHAQIVRDLTRRTLLAALTLLAGLTLVGWLA